jgi:hypothetical protein
VPPLLVTETSTVRNCAFGLSTVPWMVGVVSTVPPPELVMTGGSMKAACAGTAPTNTDAPTSKRAATLAETRFRFIVASLRGVRAVVLLHRSGCSQYISPIADYSS